MVLWSAGGWTHRCETSGTEGCWLYSNRRFSTQAGGRCPQPLRCSRVNCICLPCYHISNKLNSRMQAPLGRGICLFGSLLNLQYPEWCQGYSKCSINHCEMNEYTPAWKNWKKPSLIHQSYLCLSLSLTRLFYNSVETELHLQKCSDTNTSCPLKCTIRLMNVQLTPCTQCGRNQFFCYAPPSFLHS